MMPSAVMMSLHHQANRLPPPPAVRRGLRRCGVADRRRRLNYSTTTTMTTRASIAQGGTHAIPQPAIVGTVDVVVVVVLVLVVLVLLKEEGAASHQFGGAPDGNARLPRVVAAVVSRLRRRVERSDSTPSRGAT